MSLDSLSASIAYASMVLSITAVLLAVVRRFRDPELRFLRSSVASLRAGLDEVTQIIHDMNERDRMRRVRAGTSSSKTQPGSQAECPDPSSDPEGWKRWMRKHNPPRAR